VLLSWGRKVRDAREADLVGSGFCGSRETLGLLSEFSFLIPQT
jgi:hypothetical protein